jgi:hypothetical protein
MIHEVKKANIGTFYGWGKKHYGGCYGSAQIQGYLSYFYGEFYPERAVELNPCVYR